MKVTNGLLVRVLQPIGMRHTDRYTAHHLAWAQIDESVPMSAFKSSKLSTRQLLYWSLILMGLALAVWQFFTFVALVEGHTAHAQTISRYAGWSGQPVGTMPQPSSTPIQGIVHVQHTGAVKSGIVRADEH